MRFLLNSKYVTSKSRSLDQKLKKNHKIKHNITQISEVHIKAKYGTQS